MQVASEAAVVVTAVITVVAVIIIIWTMYTDTDLDVAVEE